MNQDEQLRSTFRLYEQQINEDGSPLAEQAIAKAHSDRRKRLATIAGTLCAVLLVALAVGLEASTRSSSDTAGEGDPPGKAIGEDLGLAPIAWPPPKSCTHYAAYDTDSGFCIDSVTDDPAELVILTQRINGYAMNQARIDFITAWIQLDELRHNGQPLDPVEEKRLQAILDQTHHDAVEPLNDPVDLDQFEGLTGEDLGHALGLVPMVGPTPIVLCNAIQELGNVNGHDWGYCLEGLTRDEESQNKLLTLLSGQDFKRYPVPDVVGLSENEAIAALQEAGLQAEVRRSWDDSPEGTVFSQYPRAGKTQVGRIPVSVYVSKGQPAWQSSDKKGVTPNVVGTAQDQAEVSMKKAGFHVTLTKATHTPGIPRGTVVKQDPAAGTTAPQNEGVKLWVED